ncbi:AtpZ/AtpI family protein [Bacillota bacterium LX-D]|nr:AtpZ/AtpI family protein [Bacillota bacterium LX-D]
MEDKNHEKKKSDSVYMSAIGQATQVGVTMMANIFVGLFFGRFLDSIFHTKPWLTIVFILLGALAGFWGTYKLITSKER